MCCERRHDKKGFTVTQNVVIIAHNLIRVLENPEVLKTLEMYGRQ